MISCMEERVLSFEEEAVHFDGLGSAPETIASHVAECQAYKGSLQDFSGEGVAEEVFVEEDGFEGFPVFDVPAVEVVVFCSKLRGKGSEEFGDLAKS